MLRIRFFRKGRKKQPFYKIVVTDKNNPPSGGRFVEDVGFYNPLTKECKLEGERVLYWMEKGAHPTDVVKNLLITKGVIKGEKVNVVSISKKRKEKISGKKQAEAAATEKAKEMKEVVEETIQEQKVEEEVVDSEPQTPEVEEKEVVEEDSEEKKTATEEEAVDSEPQTPEIEEKEVVEEESGEKEVVTEEEVDEKKE